MSRYYLTIDILRKNGACSSGIGEFRRIYNLSPRRCDERVFFTKENIHKALNSWDFHNSLYWLVRQVNKTCGKLAVPYREIDALVYAWYHADVDKQVNKVYNMILKAKSQEWH